eukprot:1047763-Amphidinium_carterae.1
MASLIFASYVMEESCQRVFQQGVTRRTHLTHGTHGAILTRKVGLVEAEAVTASRSHQRPR